MKAYLASLAVAVLVSCGGVLSAHAQSVDQIEADIPFPFHAGMVTFPAGKYGFQVTEVAGTSTMEARSEDGLYMALMEIRNVKADVPVAKSRLVFTESNGHHFLANIFASGEPYGRTVVSVGYAVKLGAYRTDGDTVEVPAHRSTQ
ncbi:hypothetical protein [Terriglobus roseus]|uniref:DUF2846 domain-containing protein n=1 Tax=Terriglobus roseus TaxID=392734 RepID=A0A1H4J0G2_9BACT|nr:hypothetical protein [Terriglobus roseus]SEB39727.1 hypothetical protein SAMN05443244_0258 [Terriglobus roseus]